MAAAEALSDFIDDGTFPADGSVNLEFTLRATIEALTRLDPDCLESLARACERMTSTTTITEAQGALHSYRVLGCLLEHTRRNLELLSRITERSNEEYGNHYRAFCEVNSSSLMSHGSING